MGIRSIKLLTIHISNTYNKNCFLQMQNALPYIGAFESESDIKLLLSHFFQNLPLQLENYNFFRYAILRFFMKEHTVSYHYNTRSKVSSTVSYHFDRHKFSLYWTVWCRTLVESLLQPFSRKAPIFLFFGFWSFFMFLWVLSSIRMFLIS